MHFLFVSCSLQLHLLSFFKHFSESAEARHHPGSSWVWFQSCWSKRVLLWLTLHVATAGSRFLQAPNWPGTSHQDERIKTLQTRLALLAWTWSKLWHEHEHLLSADAIIRARMVHLTFVWILTSSWLWFSSRLWSGWLLWQGWIQIRVWRTTASFHLRFAFGRCQTTSGVSQICKRLIFPFNWRLHPAHTRLNKREDEKAVDSNETLGSSLTDRCLQMSRVLPPAAAFFHICRHVSVSHFWSCGVEYWIFGGLFPLFRHNNGTLACIAHQRQPRKRVSHGLDFVIRLNYSSEF